LTKIVLVILALAASDPANAQSTNPLTSGARLHYGIIKGFVTRAAAKMPEEKYAFRPTPEVRTFAQLIGHLAGGSGRSGGAGRPDGSAALVFTYLTHLTYPTRPTHFFTSAGHRS
jgi:hypothetical protein